MSGQDLEIKENNFDFDDDTIITKSEPINIVRLAVLKYLDFGNLRDEQARAQTLLKELREKNHTCIFIQESRPIKIRWCMQEFCEDMPPLDYDNDYDQDDKDNIVD